MSFKNQLIEITLSVVFILLKVNLSAAFCKICQEMGYPIYAMDVICAGEEFHAAMKRSTNGGGENSPKIDGEDDFYELFLAGLLMEE